MFISNIKTIEDAFAATGRDIAKLPDVSMLPEKDRNFLIALYKINVLREAINTEANGGQPWNPDWDKWEQNKYYPWFDMSTKEDQPAGSGFSFYACFCDGTYSHVGSRLCYISLDAACYAGKQFLELYKEFFVLI